jgi:hypothetical protein
MSMPVRALAAAVIGVLVGTTAGRAQSGPASSGGDGYRAAIQTAAGELGRQMDLLQDVIADEPSARQGRGLWKLSDNVNTFLASLKQQLRSGAARADLYQAFDRLDGPLQQMLGDINALGPQERALKRAAARVRAAGLDLHFAVFGGDGGGARRCQVLARQALALRGAVVNLERVAQYLLQGEDSWTDLQADFRNLRRATAGFQRMAEEKADPKQLQASFARLKQAWAELAVDFQLLPSNSGLLLQNYATRLDSIYGRLYGLMGLKGYRPSLVSGN